MVVKTNLGDIIECKEIISNYDCFRLKRDGGEVVVLKTDVEWIKENPFK